MKEYLNKTPDGTEVCLDCVSKESNYKILVLKEIIDKEGIEVKAVRCMTHEAIKEFFDSMKGE